MVLIVSERRSPRNERTECMRTVRTDHRNPGQRTVVPLLVLGLLMAAVSAANALGGAPAALESLGPQAIRTLIKRLRDPDDSVRIEAAHTLRKIGPPAVPALTALMRDPDRRMRYRALMILGRMELEAKAAIPAMTEALHDPEWNVRCMAIEALEGMGAEGKIAIPALALLLRDPDANIRTAAARVLRKLGPFAVPVLTKMVRDADCNARYHAIVALGQMGLDARTAIPAITGALQDPAWAVRHAAAAALEEIRKSVLPSR
jgi:HEAT repeat protein